MDQRFLHYKYSEIIASSNVNMKFKFLLPFPQAQRLFSWVTISKAVDEMDQGSPVARLCDETWAQVTMLASYMVRRHGGDQNVDG